MLPSLHHIISYPSFSSKFLGKSLRHNSNSSSTFILRCRKTDQKPKPFKKSPHSPTFDFDHLKTNPNLMSFSKLRDLAVGRVPQKTLNRPVVNVVKKLSKNCFLQMFSYKTRAIPNLPGASHQHDVGCRFVPCPVGSSDRVD